LIRKQRDAYLISQQKYYGRQTQVHADKALAQKKLAEEHKALAEKKAAEE